MSTIRTNEVEAVPDLEGVCVKIREDGESLPLFIEPKGDKDSVEYLKRWVGENKKWLKEKIVQHGAVMISGFDIKEGIDFQEVVQQYEPKLSDAYRGTSPRKLIPGTQYVFSASELPRFYPIPQHIEMSFLPAPPRQLFFCCLDEPTSAGGETCLCDFKKVYDQMDPDVRQKFEDKGLMYIRNYHRKKTLFTDPTMLKGWEDVFATADKAEVEEDCQISGIEYSWGNKDKLRLINKAAAVETHPVTGDKIWFNHANIYHRSNLHDELHRVYKRLGGVTYWVLSWMTYLMYLILAVFTNSWNGGFHTVHKDGTELDTKELHHIRDTIWKNLVFNRWKKGDILLIDNMRISHGRQPFTGKRKVVVSWTEPILKPSEQEKAD